MRPASAGAYSKALLADVAELAGCSSITHVGNVVCAHAPPVVEKLLELAGGGSAGGSGGGTSRRGGGTGGDGRGAGKGGTGRSGTGESSSGGACAVCG